MIWTSIEIIAILAECFLIARLLVEYFHCKQAENRIFHILCLTGCLLLFDLLGTFVIKNELFFITSFILCGSVYAMIALKGNVFEKIYVNILSYIMIYFSNLPLLFLITHLTQTNIHEFTYASQNVVRASSILIAKVIFYILTQCVLILHKKKEFHFKKAEWIIILSAFATTLLIGLFVLLLASGSSLSQYLFIMITVLLCILDIIIFVFLQKLSTINHREQMQSILAVQVKQQQKDIEQLDRQYHELSILRHDYKNQIECIRCMLQKEKNTDVLRYIDTLTKRHFDFTEEHVKCSSSVLNAVINTKFSMAHAYGIRTSCMITTTIPDYLEYDISILLSNLLDNAIEACSHLDKECHIILSFAEVNGYYRLIIKNTIVESVLRKNRKLKTSKNNRTLHGWGLKSVQDIADAHNGSVDFYEKESQFIVSVLLMKH